LRRPAIPLSRHRDDDTGSRQPVHDLDTIARCSTPTGSSTSGLQRATFLPSASGTVVDLIFLAFDGAPG
jgi:hypothetical protein